MGGQEKEEVRGKKDGREVTQERGRRTGKRGYVMKDWDGRQGTKDRGQRRGERWEDRERRTRGMEDRRQRRVDGC
jgi:hypothetical protein